MNIGGAEKEFVAVKRHVLFHSRTHVLGEFPRVVPEFVACGGIERLDVVTEVRNALTEAKRMIRITSSFGHRAEHAEVVHGRGQPEIVGDGSDQATPARLRSIPGIQNRCFQVGGVTRGQARRVS